VSEQQSLLSMLKTRADKAKSFARAAQHIRSIKVRKQPEKSNVVLNTCQICTCATDEVIEICTLMFASFQTQLASTLEHLAEDAMNGESKISFVHLPKMQISHEVQAGCTNEQIGDCCEENMPMQNDAE